MKFFDAQQAMSFLVQQATHIENQVYEVAYPDIQYPSLLPIDMSANEWARTVTFFSSDKVGKAEWFSAQSNDVPRADVVKTKFEKSIEMAAIGYGYDLEELGAAMLVPGTNLTMDRAAAARRAYEEFMDGLALRGRADKGLEGLINYTGITAIDAQGDGTSSSTFWTAKSGDQILRDVNDALTGAYVDSLTVEMCDTILLPVSAFTLISTKRLGDTEMTILRFLQLYNVYTAMTGQQLTIRAVRGLEVASPDGGGRMVAYRRAMDVLKLHLPMPHKFLPVWQTGPLRFDIPGIFRTGGVEIRRPGAVRYLDEIMDAPT